MIDIIIILIIEFILSIVFIFNIINYNFYLLIPIYILGIIFGALVYNTTCRCKKCRMFSYVGIFLWPMAPVILIMNKEDYFKKSKLYDELKNMFANNIDRTKINTKEKIENELKNDKNYYFTDDEFEQQEIEREKRTQEQLLKNTKVELSTTEDEKICKVCQVEIKGMNGKQCKYCNRYYCMEHLQPEKHNCDGDVDIPKDMRGYSVEYRK